MCTTSKYKHLNPVVVRIPYVTDTDRLYYYCKNIVNETTMKIDDINRGFSFIRDTEVGFCLSWIASQDFSGVLNLSSTGCIKIKDIISYIENKVNKKARISANDGEESPFHVYDEKDFSMNIHKLEKLGYQPSSHTPWFWKLIDEYIAKALKEKK